MISTTKHLTRIMVLRRGNGSSLIDGAASRLSPKKVSIQHRWRTTGKATRKRGKAINKKKLTAAVFGLELPDYSVPPPLVPMIPPPPPKKGLAQFYFPASLAITFGVVVYFYFNNKNDSFAYWEAMEKGEAYLEDDDDDDDDDDEDDDM